jgi:hypothetical protein
MRRLTAPPLLPGLQTPNDIYWMPHIDRDTYGSFVFTSLLYLNTMHADFEVCMCAALHSTSQAGPRKGS